MTVGERMRMTGTEVLPLFGPSGLEGAGFQNCIAISPDDPNIVLMGSDVGGIMRSTDGGKKWTRAQDNFWLSSQMKIASIAWFPDVPGRALAVCGQSGAGGGIWESNNWGSSWTLKTQLVGFSGGNNKAIASGSPAIQMNPDDGTNFPHPRSTGKLIVFDTAAQRVYVGSFKDGVFWAAYSNTASWTVVPGTTSGSGVNGSDLWIRCMAINPLTGHIFFGTYRNGLWKIASGALTHLVTTPDIFEDLSFGEPNTLYCACNTYGILKIPNAEGIGFPAFTVVDITGSLDTSTSHWQSIEAVLPDIYAGCAKPLKDSGDSLMVLSSGVWSRVFDPSNLHYTISGPSGPVWFHSNYSPQSMPLGNSFVVSQLAHSGSKFLIAGRSGAWGTEDTFANCYPYVDDLGVTISRGLATGLEEEDVMIGNADWVVLRSRDGARTVQTFRPGPNVGYDIEQFEDRFYVAIGGRDTNSLGKVYSALITDSSWTDERLYNVADVTDNFTRTVVNGWGASSDGHGTYTLSPAVDAYRFSVNGGSARIIVGPVAGTPEARLPAIVAGDSEGLGAFSFPDAPVGGPKFGSFLLRRSTGGGPASFYECRVQLNLNGSLSAFIRRVNSAVQTYQGIVVVLPAGGYVLGTIMRFRWVVYTDPTDESTTVQFRVWKTTDFEPAAWTVELNDGSSDQILDEGGIYQRAGAGTGTTAATAVDFWSWTASGTGSNADKRPLSLVAFRDGGGVLKTVVAVDNDKIYYKHAGDVAFTAAFGTSPMAGGEAPQKWTDMIYMGAGCLLLIHQRTGLWRSLNYGDTWSHISSPAAFNTPYTGYLTFDPVDISTAYLATQNNVYRVNNVRGTPSLTNLTSSPSNPGALRWTPNRGLLLVKRPVANGDRSQLYSSTNHGVTWRKISDANFERTATFVFDLTPSASGTDLYVSTSGNGVIVSRR